MASMMATLGVDKLTLDEQSQLLQELQLKFRPDKPSDNLLTEAQRAELNRRIAYMDAHPEEWLSWEEFYEGTLKKYQL